MVEGSNSVRQVRFNWSKTVLQDRQNRDALDMMAAYAVSHGTDYVSEVKDLLAVIELGDMKARMKTKYESLQKTWRGTAGGEKGKVSATKDNRARGVSFLFEFK